MVRIEVQVSSEEAAAILEACRAAVESKDQLEGLLAISDAALRGTSPERPPVEISSSLSMVHFST